MESSEVCLPQGVCDSTAQNITRATPREDELGSSFSHAIHVVLSDSRDL